MTAIRKSYRIAPERSFGSGEPKNGIWYEVPQGMYLSHSDSTQAASLYGTGAKIRQNTVYGPFQGSWNASFVMDFEHLEILSMIFDVEDETYSAEKPYGANRAVSGMTGVYDHVFRKHNSRRQPSYVIQERVLNIIAGGEYDETVTLKGVLARNIQLARSTSGSQMAAEISGVFADKCTELHSEQQESFFTPVSDPLSQYSCMYMGLNADPADTDAVEQVDSHSIQIETSVSLVYSTCSPIATGYFEDKTTFSWNASAYMNNPTKKFKLLSNSGGTLDPKVGDSLKITDPDNGRSYSKQPMGKNLAPLEFVNFITYAESYRDEYSAVYASRVDAYDKELASIEKNKKNNNSAYINAGLSQYSREDLVVLFRSKISCGDMQASIEQWESDVLSKTKGLGLIRLMPRIHEIDETLNRTLEDLYERDRKSELGLNGPHWNYTLTIGNNILRHFEKEKGEKLSFWALIIAIIAALIMLLPYIAADRDGRNRGLIWELSHNRKSSSSNNHGGVIGGI